MHQKEFSTEIGGEKLTARFTNLTDQADGSVLLQCGNTVVLATVVMSETPNESAGYFPLRVDYEERFYAAGQILGSRFMRREGRPSDEAILSGRIVDRTIRPLFDGRIRHDIQVIITILSIGKYDPDTLAVNAASLALATSRIPWNGPVSAVRLGKQGDDVFVVNPTYATRDEAATTLDLLVCGKDGNINMVEIGSHQVSEEVIAEGFTQAVSEIEKLQTWQKQIVAEIGTEKTKLTLPEVTPETQALFAEHIKPKLAESVFIDTPGKGHINTLKDAWMDIVAEHAPDEDRGLAGELFEEAVDALLHQEALTNNRRVDGRTMDEVRPLFAQAGGMSEALHGSGTFYRGGTHILSVLTLGGPEDSQIIEGMEIQTKKHFMHHYNFPPFSTGEVGRVGGFNRRAIGHGALAEKALTPVIPAQENFPYTIRIVSEAMASNGSTSMGSVCGSTLALMDAGVPISEPVAGIAMGLMLSTDGTYAVLTDIQGPEDHHGDMDFKVAGTKNGVTAIQMDVKVDGVPVAILIEALGKARAARLHILETITSAIPAPRDHISPHAPEILSTTIKEEHIGMIIGSGGKTVKGIKEKTGAEVTIEDDGTVYFTGKNGSAQAAKDIVEALTKEYAAGERFDGIVKRIESFGAFVQIGPDIDIPGAKPAEGLVHISEIAPFRIDRVDAVLSVGETIPVILKEIDEKERMNLSLKDADPEFATRKGVKPSEHTDRPSHGQRNHGRHNTNNTPRT